MRDASTKNAARPRCRLAPSPCRLARSLLGSGVWRLTFLLAIAWLWPLQSAHAEPLLVLRWSTPPSDTSCPDLAWARARIETQLGQSITRDVTRGVNADVAIVGSAKGFTLSLRTTWNDEIGARTLEGARCTELSDAAILIVALSVSEAHEQAETEAHLAAQGATTSPTKGSATAPVLPPQRGPSKPVLGAFLRADALIDVGLWDRPTFGPGLTLGLEQGMFRAELSGLWFPPLTLRAKGREIEATLGAVRASGCLLFGARRVRGGGCAGAEFGGVRAHNAAASRTPRTWWGAALVGGRIQVALIARLSLVASADLLVALTQLEFSSREVSASASDTAPDQISTLHRSERLQLRASFGPELRF
jgi:hypothetical protein